MCMSVAELRMHLESLAAQLPTAKLAVARRNLDESQADLAEAWRGSDHPSAQAAQAAASAAADHLADIIAALECAAEDISAYNEGL